MRVLLLLVIGVYGNANAEIYKCLEAGRVTYSNAQSAGCTRLNVGPVNAAPSPKASGGSGGSGSSKSASPEGFPRVNSETQRSRDDDRRRILDQELMSEQTALAAARKALSEQEGQVLPEERNVGGRGLNGAKLEQRLQPFRDKVALHERNIEALRKEIANLR